MLVEIPSRIQHEGIYKATYKISDSCPVCGSPRGKSFRTLSYDGSRRMDVDGWINPCGHVDVYSAIRAEAALSKN